MPSDTSAACKPGSDLILADSLEFSSCLMFWSCLSAGNGLVVSLVLHFSFLSTGCMKPVLEEHSSFSPVVSSSLLSMARVLSKSSKISSEDRDLDPFISGDTDLPDACSFSLTAITGSHGFVVGTDGRLGRFLGFSSEEGDLDLDPFISGDADLPGNRWFLLTAITGSHEFVVGTDGRLGRSLSTGLFCFGSEKSIRSRIWVGRLPRSAKLTASLFTMPYF